MNKRWFIHTAVVETNGVGNAYGDNLADPIADIGYLEGGTKLIRDQTGQQVVSTSTWYTDLANIAHYTPDSQFTAPDGRVARVIGVNSFQTPLGVEDHVEVYLT
jgi:hypothetical protein